MTIIEIGEQSERRAMFARSVDCLLAPTIIEIGEQSEWRGKFARCVDCLLATYKLLKYASKMNEQASKLEKY